MHWGCSLDGAGWLFGFCPQGFDTTLGYLEPGGLAMIWEFPKIRGTLFGGPYDKDPTI